MGGIFFFAFVLGVCARRVDHEECRTLLVLGDSALGNRTFWVNLLCMWRWCRAYVCSKSRHIIMVEMSITLREPIVRFFQQEGQCEAPRTATNRRCCFATTGLDARKWGIFPPKLGFLGGSLELFSFFCACTVNTYNNAA